MSVVWAMKAIAGDRQYTGNHGYEDDPAARYVYDSDVPNHRRVAPGDLAFVHDRHSLIAVGRIERIDVDEDVEKERLRCPECGQAGPKLRPTKVPPYRCNAGHEFDEPRRTVDRVTTFEARYGNTAVEIGAVAFPAQMRRQHSAGRWNENHSIVQLSPARLHDLIGGNAAALRLLETWDQTHRSVVDDEGEPYEPGMADERSVVLGAIRRRRGQKRFRDGLLRRHGACQITGCTIVGVLEAAHIWPYRGEADNHPQNGLLLRADVHTLFDLDLLAIEPQSLRVVLSRDLDGSEYEMLRGVVLEHDGRRPSVDAIGLRWNAFRILEATR